MPGLGNENLRAIESSAVVNGALLAVVLLGLVVADWRSGIRRSPFWLVIASTLFIHIGFFTLAKSTGWTSFVEWFGRL